MIAARCTRCLRRFWATLVVDSTRVSHRRHARTFTAAAVAPQPATCIEAPAEIDPLDRVIQLLGLVKRYMPAQIEQGTVGLGDIGRTWSISRQLSRAAQSDARVASVIADHRQSISDLALNVYDTVNVASAQPRKLTETFAHILHLILVTGDVSVAKGAVASLTSLINDSHVMLQINEECHLLLALIPIRSLITATSTSAATVAAYEALLTKLFTKLLEAPPRFQSFYTDLSLSAVVALYVDTNVSKPIRDLTREVLKLFPPLSNMSDRNFSVLVTTQGDADALIRLSEKNYSLLEQSFETSGMVVKQFGQMFHHIHVLHIGRDVIRSKRFIRMLNHCERSLEKMEALRASNPKAYHLAMSHWLFALSNFLLWTRASSPRTTSASDKDDSRIAVLRERLIDIIDRLCLSINHSRGKSLLHATNHCLSDTFYSLSFICQSLETPSSSLQATLVYLIHQLARLYQLAQATKRSGFLHEHEHEQLIRSSEILLLQKGVSSAVRRLANDLSMRVHMTK